jgi:hypothetical protein
MDLQQVFFYVVIPEVFNRESMVRQAHHDMSPGACRRVDTRFRGHDDFLRDRQNKFACKGRPYCGRETKNILSPHPRANALCIKSKLIRQKSNYESKKTAWETSFPQFVSGNPALLLLDAR